MFPTTPTGIAKMAAQMAVAMQVTKILTNLVTTNTDLDPDGIPVKVGCVVGGNLVAWKASPLTDAAVQKASDVIVELRTAKQDTTQTETK